MYERNRLYFDRFKLVPVIIPSIKEQREIINSIRYRTKEIDISLNCFMREIELLREYRTRLVADVVTGKLDVREVAKTLPEETFEDDFSAADEPDAEDVADGEEE